MEKKWILTGLALLIISIILGAFGAHTLKETYKLDPDKLVSFETGVRYQMIHAVLFLVLPFILVKYKLSGKAVFWMLILGVLFFSGSIYGLTWCNVAGLEDMKKGFGPITPIGGLLLILGWILLFVQVLRSSNE